MSDNDSIVEIPDTLPQVETVLNDLEYVEKAREEFGAEWARRDACISQALEDELVRYKSILKSQVSER